MPAKRDRTDRDLIRGRDAKEDAFLDQMAGGAPVDPEKVQVGARIKARRTRLGMTLTDLADKTGFSTAFLSQLENQLISPPLGAMIHLAEALACQVGELIHDLTDAPYQIIRAEERRPASRYATKGGVSYGYSYESLADISGGVFIPLLVTLDPQAQPRPPATHDGQEFLYVLFGQVEITLGQQTQVLRKGDSIAYLSKIPHRLVCKGDKPAVMLAVLSGRH
jgi:quercetin dioxygenase-like cupin family protein/DNA-binding Xre family transcriptional regulator